MEGILKDKGEVYNSAGWCGGEVVLAFKLLEVRSDVEKAGKGHSRC